MINGLIFGLIFGLFSLLIREIKNNQLFIVFPLISGLISGLFSGVIGGFFKLTIDTKNISNQGIWNSLKNGLTGGLIIGLIFGLLGGSITGLTGALINGLIIGLIFGLIFGIDSVIQHLTLRLILYRNGDIPWNYAKFLEHAVKHRFIQRVGGRYRFMHDLLRKHFAQMPLS